MSQPDSHALVGCAFCLDLWSVFSISRSVFSPLIHLHTNIYQHSWKWLVINPYHYVDVYILYIYAGVDGLKLVLSSRQQPLHGRSGLVVIVALAFFLPLLHSSPSPSSSPICYAGPCPSPAFGASLTPAPPPAPALAPVPAPAPAPSLPPPPALAQEDPEFDLYHPFGFGDA